VTAYGDPDEIERQLTAGGVALGAPEVARIAALNEALSRLFDAKCNRTGTSVETRTVDAPAPWATLPIVATPFPPSSGFVADLVLPWPVLAVTAIDEGGTWNGTTWDDGTALAVADYRLAGGDAVAGYRRIERLSGLGWAGPVRIAGTWINAAWTSPPAIVVEALNFLVAHHYREDAASPGGLVGGDGLQMPARNPWAYERVKAAIRTYGIYELVI
jgi:hypothetical protein